MSLVVRMWLNLYAPKKRLLPAVYPLSIARNRAGVQLLAMNRRNPSITSEALTLNLCPVGKRLVRFRGHRHTVPIKLIVAAQLPKAWVTIISTASFTISAASRLGISVSFRLNISVSMQPS